MCLRCQDVVRPGLSNLESNRATVLKTHPNVNVVTAHKLAIAPLSQTANNSNLLDAVSLLLRSYPDLNDAGFAGYAYWFRNFPTTFVGNVTLNEGDRHHPEHFDAFYGSQYTHHLSTKQKYDPARIFYCATCIGAERSLKSQRRHYAELELNRITCTTYTNIPTDPPNPAERRLAAETAVIWSDWFQYVESSGEPSARGNENFVSTKIFCMPSSWFSNL